MKTHFIKNQIHNYLDERLIDCICRQNKNNYWLQVRDIASWVFETNNPNPFQKNYTLRKLNSLVGLTGTAKQKQSPFESSYDPEVEYCLLYRLKDSTEKAEINRLASVNGEAQVEEFPF